MTGPDRIWAWTSGQSAGLFDTSFHDNIASATEYIRRDPAVLAALPEVQALIAARDAAMRAEGMREGVAMAWALGWRKRSGVSDGRE